MNFKKGQILLAKDEYIDEHETLKDTIGIVLDYNPENDYLQLGCLHPERYAIPPVFCGCGEFYRLATDDEIKMYAED